MLLLIQRMKFDDADGVPYADGVPRSWVPRKKMAEKLGIGEGTVSNHIQDLKAKGFLEEEERGGNGRCSTYRIMPAIIVQCEQGQPKSG